MHELTTPEWEAILRTTLTGNVFWASKYAIPHLIEAGGGSIVNISSGGSLFGVPGISIYSAAKGGMNALTRTMAVEYAQYGIRVNTIIVGRVVAYAQDQGPEMTNMLTRVGNPRDIGYVALWLAADESEWITGTRGRRRRRPGDQQLASCSRPVRSSGARSPSRSGRRRTRGTAPPSPRRCARSSTPSGRRGVARARSPPNRS